MVACPLLVTVAKAMTRSFHSYIIDYCKDYRACQQVTISAWVDREVPMPLRTFEKRLATCPCQSDPRRTDSGRPLAPEEQNDIVLPAFGIDTNEIFINNVKSRFF